MNRLANETSPYLRQHADNPVDWYPWGEEALQAARSAIDAPAESYTPLAGSLKTLESNLESEESRRKPFPRTSTGRRSAWGWTCR